MDFEFMSADINDKQDPPQKPNHHKKNSTFANVPFAETDGLDDFFGFSVEETELNTQKKQIKDLKETIKQNENVIDNKDKIINQLRTENNELKNTINRLKLQISDNKKTNTSKKRRTDSSSSTSSSSTNTIESGQGNADKNMLTISKSGINAISSIVRPSPTSQTTKGSFLFSNPSKQRDSKSHLKPFTNSNNKNGLKHCISPSLNNFLDKLDIKFNEDEDGKNKQQNKNQRSPVLFSSISDNLDKDEDNDYISTVMMDIDGHLPQLRRSSLSEEEQERMEMEAVQEMKDNTNDDNKADNNNNTNHDDETASNSFKNVIFNDSKVNNMNMNIINHHNHTYKHSNDRHANNSNILYHLKHDIENLKYIIEEMKKSKIELIISTSNEIDHLRAIIAKYIK